MFHRRKSGTGSDPPGLLFLPARGKGLTRFSDALLFLSVSRGREKNKKQKETPRPTGFFSQAPHSFFSKPTGRNGQVARLDLAGFACNLHASAALRVVFHAKVLHEVRSFPVPQSKK